MRWFGAESDRADTVSQNQSFLNIGYELIFNVFSCFAEKTPA